MIEQSWFIKKFLMCTEDNGLQICILFLWSRWFILVLWLVLMHTCYPDWLPGLYNVMMFLWESKIVGFIFLFLHTLFGCVLQINGLLCKAPLRARNRKGDLLHSEWCWGQEWLWLVVRCLPTPSQIILCFFGCCPRNAIVGEGCT
jgi:hypothetical protein